MANPTAAIDFEGRFGGLRNQVSSQADWVGGRFSSTFSRAASGFGSSIKTALKGAAALGAGLFAGAALGAKAALDAASDYEESLSKIGQVFGPKQQAEMEKWAASAAEGFGQSKSQALEAAGTYGNLLTSFGLSADASSDMSTSLVQLASDLASFNNTSPDEALQALQSGLTGEMEPLKRFGIALDDASLRQKALALGISDGTSALTPAQKAQASYALIMERSANAQGDFARTSNGAANQQRIFAARIEDLKIKVGQALLPALNAVLPVLSNLFDRLGPLIDQALPKLKDGFAAISAWWQQNGPAIQAAASNVFGAWLQWMQALIGWWQENGPAIMEAAQRVFGALSSGLQAVATVVQQYWPQISSTVQTVLSTVQTIVQGAVDVVMTLWNNFGNNILDVLKRIVEPIRMIISGAMEVIRSVIETVTSLIRGDWQGVWDGLKGIVEGAWRAIQGIVRGAAELLRGAFGIVAEVIGSISKAAWEGLSNFVSERIADVVGFVKGIPARLGEFAGNLTESLLAPFRAAFRAIANLWNSTVGSLSFTAPDWAPGIGGKGFDVPDIPVLHTGGVVPGRPGQEVLALLEAGERVLTRDQQRQTQGPAVTVNAGAVQDPATLAALTGQAVGWAMARGA